MKVQIKNLPISKLAVNDGQIEGLPKNPRLIKDERFKKLVKSLKEAPEMLNLRELIVIEHEGQYIVIGGNMRLRASQALGLKELPCKILPADTPAEKLREYTIKDNNGFGENDWDLLANEWDTDELQEWGTELPVDWDTTEAPGGVKDDEFDEEATVIECKCHKGDKWQLGGHIIMCGDSSDSEDFNKLMGGVKADMVFTDPPYGVAIGDKNKTLNQFLKGGRMTENIKNDNIDLDSLYNLLVKAMTNVKNHCSEKSCYYVTSPQGGDLSLMMMMMKEAGLPVKHILIWKKNYATFSMGRLDYDYQHEPIFYTWTKAHHNYRNGEKRTTIWDYDKPRKSDLHPTMKPIELVANAILDGTKEGDVVLDAFGGSGTTLIACEQLKRKCYMMELDPHYCDVIISRWEKLTGLQAKKIS